MMGRPYTVSEDKKKQYAGIYVLEYMINNSMAFPLLLSGPNADLESILEWHLIKGYVDIRDKEKYVPTEKGHEVLTKFLARYSEYLNAFDIYCAVDLEAGEFAFASYFDYENASAWRAFINDERWEDLRIAVAEFKKLGPVEIVFMNFIAEKRFGRDSTGWQFDLLLGTVWDEILEICNTSIRWQDLGYEDEEGEVSGEQAIKDIITQGAELIVNLHKKEARLALPIEHEDSKDGNRIEEVVEHVVIKEHPVDYYYDYYDPYYVSPPFRSGWMS